MIDTWDGTPVTGTWNFSNIYNAQDHSRAQILTKCIQVTTSIDIGVPSIVPSSIPSGVLGESSKYNQILISPLSCQHFLYLPIMKDGDELFFDSIGNILTYSTSEDIPQVYPNVPYNLLQGPLFHQDDLLSTIKLVNGGPLLIKSINIYTHLSIDIINLGEGTLLFATAIKCFESLSTAIKCFESFFHYNFQVF